MYSGTGEVWCAALICRRRWRGWMGLCYCIILWAAVMVCWYCRVGDIRWWRSWFAEAGREIRAWKTDLSMRLFVISD